MSLARENSWLRCLKPVERPEYRLFCLPHSGGNPSLFRQWSATLSPSVEMIAVQLPGRASRLREAPYERLEPLLQALLAALRPALDDAPFALFGHSFGALLAFELIHALQDDGPQPVAFFVSACHAPHLLPTGETLHTLPRAQLLDALRRLNGTPQELFAEVELLDMILPAMRADLAIYETYVYRQRPALSVPIIACGGRDDVRVTPAQLEAWREQAAGHFEYRLFAGNHFYLNDARPQLIKIIERILVV